MDTVVNQATPHAEMSAPSDASAHGRIVRPTAERLAMGKWHKPGRAAPMTDLHHDAIATLYDQHAISSAQHDAARLYEGIRAAYRQEIGAAGYRSCLDIGVGAYDSGDGNPAAARDMRAIKDKAGRIGAACIEQALDGGRFDVDALIVALDRLNA